MAICLRHPLRLQSLHKNTFYYIIIINYDFENKEETMKLYENGAYLVNGRDVVINSPEAASAVNARQERLLHRKMQRNKPLHMEF